MSCRDIRGMFPSLTLADYLYVRGLLRCFPKPRSFSITCIDAIFAVSLAFLKRVLDVWRNVTNLYLLTATTCSFHNATYEQMQKFAQQNAQSTLNSVCSRQSVCLTAPSEVPCCCPSATLLVSFALVFLKWCFTTGMATVMHWDFYPYWKCLSWDTLSIYLSIP